MVELGVHTIFERCLHVIAKVADKSRNIVERDEPALSDLRPIRGLISVHKPVYAGSAAKSAPDSPEMHLRNGLCRRRFILQRLRRILNGSAEFANGPYERLDAPL